MSNEKKPKKTEKRKIGRPTIYTEALAKLICNRVASSTLALARLCDMYDDMPNKDTINEWRNHNESFSVLYAQAKMKQADLMAEEILEIADNATNDYMESLSEDEQGEAWRYNGEHVNRSRLRIDTRKWLASKLLPRQYGDKLLLEQKSEENEKLKQELLELRKKLDDQNRKDY